MIKLVILHPKKKERKTNWSKQIEAWVESLFSYCPGSQRLGLGSSMQSENKKAADKIAEIQTKDRSIIDRPLISPDLRRHMRSGETLLFHRWRPGSILHGENLSSNLQARICKVYPASIYRLDLLELLRRVQSM